VIPFFTVNITYIAMVARKNNGPVGAIDLLAGNLVVLGTFLNTWSEILAVLFIAA